MWGEALFVVLTAFMQWGCYGNETEKHFTEKLFFSRESLDGYLTKNKCEECSVIDVKRGVIYSLEQNEVRIPKPVLDHYEFKLN